MRFLPLRQQLLFSPEGTRATRPQPLKTRGKSVQARPTAGSTGQQRQDEAGKAGEGMRAPALPVVEDSPRGEQIRSLFEVAGTGIMMALFLVAAIFA